ncbi:MAG: nucleoside deaminase [Oscillospiraceae bacterium]
MKTEFIPKKEFMLLALTLAEEAAQDGEVPVGAVVELNGRIIGTGRNRREKAGSALGHAEIEAIHAACKALGGWRLTGANLYVTLEPCPMCAGAAVNSRIQTVIFGAEDEKAGSCGTLVNLFALPYNHRPAIFRGFMESEAKKILRDFFAPLRNTRSPL